MVRSDLSLSLVTVSMSVRFVVLAHKAGESLSPLLSGFPFRLICLGLTRDVT